jgi:hypothetical protein
VDTVHWLCDQIHEHHALSAKLDRESRRTDEEIRKRMAQVEERTEERFGIIEKAMSRRAADAGNFENSEQIGSANLAATTGLGRQLAAANAANTDLANFEMELSKLQLAQKNLDQFISNSEEQQKLRDEAQDELMKMEFANINRDLGCCLREKDIEPMRTFMMSKVERIESEVKAELHQLTLQVKGEVNANADGIKQSMENIAAIADQQVSKMAESMEAWQKEDGIRFENNKTDLGRLSAQVQFLAQSIGAEIPLDIASEVAGDGIATTGESNGLSVPPQLSQPLGGTLKGASGAGVTVGNGQIRELERRLAKLEEVMGADVCDGSAFEAAVASPSGGAPKAKPPPLPNRVEKLEHAHEELTTALTENLGLVLPSGSVHADSSGGGGAASSRQWSPQSSDRKPEQATAAVQEEASQGSPRPQSRAGHAVRIDTMDAALMKLYEILGLDTLTGCYILQSQPSRPLLETLTLLNAKLNEMAYALGMSPEELEAAALSGETGQLLGRVQANFSAVSPRMAGIVAAQEDKLKQGFTQLDERVRCLEMQTGAASGGVINQFSLASTEARITTRRAVERVIWTGSKSASPILLPITWPRRLPQRVLLESPKMRGRLPRSSMISRCALQSWKVVLAYAHP